VEDYITFWRTFHDEDGFEYAGEIDPAVIRVRVTAASNIRGVLELFEKEQFNFEIFDRIRENVINYTEEDKIPKLRLDEKNIESIYQFACDILEAPYKEWMVKERFKVRANFAEDAKRTWNRIKQTAGQATKIRPEAFKEHYEQNWSQQPEEVNVKENSDYLIQRKLVFKEADMFAELLDKYKMKETIQRKGNLSAPGLDKLTYPILKYNIDSATDLMIKIMTMML
jgi:hypothetical protein